MANNSETVGHKDLRLGHIAHLLVFYNISFTCLLPRFFRWTVTHFLLRDSENDLYYHDLSFKYKMYVCKNSGSRNQLSSVTVRFCYYFTHQSLEGRNWAKKVFKHGQKPSYGRRPLRLPVPRDTTDYPWVPKDVICLNKGNFPCPRL